MSHPVAAFWLAILAMCALALGLVGRDLDVPGLYYDEVIQAEPAVEFLDPEGVPTPFPGAVSVPVLGRWLPVMIQPYMGALKSQMLVPVFALFGASAASLRLATLLLGLAGLVMFAVWVRRSLSLPVAIVASALLIVDPSFLFVSRHDWGSFVIGLFCRGGALLFLTTGWRGQSAARLLAGGLLLGLGVYNKIDFAIFLAAAGLALLLAWPGVLAAVFRAPGRAAFCVAGLALGVAPVIALLPRALWTTGHVLAARNETGSDHLSEQLVAIATTLDGTYFQRLMLTGGSFDRLADVEGAAMGIFPIVAAVAAVVSGVRLLRDARRGGADPFEVFVIVTALLSLAGMILTPRAVRIHHVLNTYPFPHLVVALFLVSLWRAPGGARWLRRAAAGGTAAAVLLVGLRIDLLTLDTIRETGGRGRWSDAVTRFARELQQEPGVEVVSLDWGFHRPLAFEARGLSLHEPIWKLRRVRRSRKPAVMEGTPRRVYLVYPAAYAVYPHGPAFLERARTLRREGDGRIEIRRHDDRVGGEAFYSVRFADPHRLVYRGGGNWEISLR